VRIVLGTSVFVSGIFFSGRCVAWCVPWSERRLTVFYLRAIIEEYERMNSPSSSLRLTGGRFLFSCPDTASEFNQTRSWVWFAGTRAMLRSLSVCQAQEQTG